jgi:alpha/beta superfamily hydrolase
MNAQTETLLLEGAAGAIEARRDLPAGTPCGIAVIAHPHPLFGGTMDNKVVQTLARAFVQCGWGAVRFNFRGVGASAGVHDAGQGEREDLLAVVRQVAPQGPLALAGFSFGAFVTSHALAALWSQRDVRHAVLVGTAASGPGAPAARNRCPQLPADGPHGQPAAGGRRTSMRRWSRVADQADDAIPGV